MVSISFKQPHSILLRKTYCHLLRNRWYGVVVVCVLVENSYSTTHELN
jgi:hypothetical protein